MLLHRNEKNLDIQAIGYMVREIIEPGNSKLYPRNFSLKDPSKWNSDMLDFFKQTEKSSILDLFNVCVLFLYLEDDLLI